MFTDSKCWLQGSHGLSAVDITAGCGDWATIAWPLLVLLVLTVVFLGAGVFRVRYE